MKYCSVLFFALLVFACSGSLPEEKRKAYREELERNQIVRVTEVEITEAAFREGRLTVNTLDSLAADTTARNAFIEGYPGRISLVTNVREARHDLERQLFEAYAQDTTGVPHDNLQNVRNDQGVVDSLLYSYPIVQADAGEKQRLVGVWNVWMAKRDIVLSISLRKK
jgi:hypothetical protein